nr:MAG TPA: hypothetical protein [Caudoviricetes sp.]
MHEIVTLITHLQKFFIVKIRCKSISTCIAID